MEFIDNGGLYNLAIISIIATIVFGLIKKLISIIATVILSVVLIAGIWYGFSQNILGPEFIKEKIAEKRGSIEEFINVEELPGEISKWKATMESVQELGRNLKGIVE